MKEEGTPEGFYSALQEARAQIAELQHKLNDSTPGSPLSRFAELYCEHNPLSGKTAELAVMERIAELERENEGLKAVWCCVHDDEPLDKQPCPCCAAVEVDRLSAALKAARAGIANISCNKKLPRRQVTPASRDRGPNKMSLDLKPGWLSRQFTDLEAPYSVAEFEALQWPDRAGDGPHPSIYKLRATVDCLYAALKVARERIEGTLCHACMNRVGWDKEDRTHCPACNGLRIALAAIDASLSLTPHE